MNTLTAQPADPIARLPIRWQPGLSLQRTPDGRALGRFFGARLSSVYQTLIASDTGQPVGREAFVRCQAERAADGREGLSPWGLFSLVADDDTLVGLDRLCRTLHVLNDPLAGDDASAGKGLLFLNVHGRLLPAVAEDHGRAFRLILEVLGRTPADIVIETPASACADPRLLGFVLSNYRLNGFRVAANLASPADLDALLQVVRPNFVKLDMRHFSDAEAVRAFTVRAREEGVRTVLTRVEHSHNLAAIRPTPDLWLQGHAVDGLVEAGFGGRRRHSAA